MATAVQALLLAGDSDEDNRGGELELREHTRALERDCGAAGVVVRAGGGVVGVEVVGVARVIVAGYENAAGSLRRVGSLQHRVDVLDAGVPS